MIHFYNDPNQKPRNKSWGEAFGEGLQSLVQHKAQQMETRNQQQLANQQLQQKAAFWQQSGLAPQFAQALAAQPESVQKSFLDRLEGLQIPGAQQQPQMQQQHQRAMNQEYKPGRAQAEERALKTQQYAQEAEQLGYTPIAQAQQMQQQGRVPVIPPQLPSEALQISHNKQAPEIQGGLRLGANPLDRRQQEQMAHAERLAEKKAELREKHDMNKFEREKFDKEQKESKEYLNKVYKKDQAVTHNEARLGRMSKLIDNGKLDSPEFVAGLNTLSHGLWGVGLDLKSLQSTDTAEFDKLSHDMLNGIQDVFGGRILQSEVDNFLKTIPTATQSDEAKKAVIENLQMFNEAKKLELKTSRDIVRENGGVVPPDLEMMVNEKISPQLDEWAERFKDQTHAPLDPTRKQSGVVKFINKNLAKIGL